MEQLMVKYVAMNLHMFSPFFLIGDYFDMFIISLKCQKVIWKEWVWKYAFIIFKKGEFQKEVGDSFWQGQNYEMNSKCK